MNRYSIVIMGILGFAGVYYALFQSSDDQRAYDAHMQKMSATSPSPNRTSRMVSVGD